MKTKQLALDALKLLDKTLQFADWENGDGEKIGEQLRNSVAALEADIAQAVEPVWQSIITALRFYANSEHYMLDDDDDFDTVSGEPENWLCSGRDESSTMIEDGTIARRALLGEPIQWIDGDEDGTPKPIEGEANHAAPQEVNAELLESLKQAMPYMEAESVISGYGYFRPSNPNNFYPDHEMCSENEIANHKAACAAYDAGNYRDDYGDGWLSPNLHVTKAPWGIGSYNDPIPEIEAQCERARIAIAKATA